MPSLNYVSLQRNNWIINFCAMQIFKVLVPYNFNVLKWQKLSFNRRMINILGYHKAYHWNHKFQHIKGDNSRYKFLENVTVLQVKIKNIVLT